MPMLNRFQLESAHTNKLLVVLFDEFNFFGLDRSAKADHRDALAGRISLR